MKIYSFGSSSSYYSKIWLCSLNRLDFVCVSITKKSVCDGDAYPRKRITFFPPFLSVSLSFSFSCPLSLSLFHFIFKPSPPHAAIVDTKKKQHVETKLVNVVVLSKKSNEHLTGQKPRTFISNCQVLIKRICIHIISIYIQEVLPRQN